MTLTASTESTETIGPFRLERRSDGVDLVWIDLPEREVNVLRPELAEPLDELLERLQGREDGVAAVLASAKEDSFVVGADVELLRGIGTEGEGRELARSAQRMIGRLSSFPRPLVAAIHGACLGGGLELALACDGRVASGHEATRLGQPEVRLGLIPGAGGTQRLPRLVGLEEALRLILTGRRIPAREARRIGLVDDVVHPAILLEVALERARTLAFGESGDRGEPPNLRSLLLEHNPVGRQLLFSRSEKKTREETGDRMPAPFAALEAIRVGVEDGLERGLEAEADAFGRLLQTPAARSLIALFLARRDLDRESGVEDTAAREAEPLEVAKVGVVGAGLMGAGIAQVTAHRAGLPVRLKDIENEALRHGLRSIREGLERQVARDRLDPRERDRVLARVRTTTGSTGFRHADVVIEAVIEDLEVKHRVLREIEELAPGAIFATNTSSLPITRIAEASARPERVVGMHYFSPVDRVPLLEVVRGERTAPEAIATCVELGKRQGKTVIVVGDGPGFYTTRVLGPYLNEATRLLLEGAPVEAVDRALEDFGFPVGPLRLLDEVGIDVAAEIAEVLHAAFGERMEPASVQQKLLDDDRHGRKNGRGLYRYQRDGHRWKRTGVDDSVYETLGVEPRDEEPDPDAIALRCALALVDEALRCLDEGIVRSARDLDAGAVLGLGFPPHLGGPARWVDHRGARRTLEDLESLRAEHGERFAPSRLLRELAGSDALLHERARR